MTKPRPDIIQFPSPNCGDRKDGQSPDMVVIHYTAMETADAAIERLCDPMTEVSAHYVISEQGDVVQLVPDAARAWHAGAGAWGDVTDVNSHSIGIELANLGPDSAAPEFPPAQMKALKTLLRSLMLDHKIDPARVIGHSDMAPGRKIDPGPYFQWQDLAIEGLSIWPSDIELAQPDWDRFKHAALAIGYRPASDCAEAWNDVLNMFRYRFRAHATGDLASIDVAIAEAMARDYPCAVSST